MFVTDTIYQYSESDIIGELKIKKEKMSRILNKNRTLIFFYFSLLLNLLFSILILNLNFNISVLELETTTQLKPFNTKLPKDTR